jgi:hypothetical protein
MSPSANLSGERTLRVRREQKAITDVKHFGELAVSYCDSDSRQATVMAVVELAENVLKYGTPDDSNASGTIGIAVDNNKVRVRATNVVGSPQDGQRAVGVVSEISKAPSVTDLYRTRLKELFDNPKLERAELGLLRIAFEGAFRLSCTYSHPVLEIVAERTCAAHR